MMKMSKRKPEPFSESSLAILVSVITLLLQLISFATTWSGSQIYLEGIFPCASLLFAIAIQATAYFFSNSLRTKVSAPKILALFAALCCSTYYSYIGIYNSVNSPVSFLQENYMRIGEELTEIYRENLEENLAVAREAVGDAAARVTAEYAALKGEQGQLEACRAALAEITDTYSAQMRAPKLASYENYEDYAAAYQAYIAGISSGSNTESEATRNGILSSYGFSSVEALNGAELTNSASLQALHAALGVPEREGEDTTLETVSAFSVQLSAAAEAAALGEDFDSDDGDALNRLFQAAKLCGYEGASAADILNIAAKCAEASKTPVLAGYAELVSALEEGRVTAANTMDLKNAMDSEILMALLKINSLLPAEEQLSFSDSRFALTDLYLIPVQSLRDGTTRITALFCLAVAALIDMLSVLFAVSLRKRTPLWKRRTLLLAGQEDYAPQIYASLPSTLEPARALADFMAHFAPSPETESDGYMMKADMGSLAGNYSLTALLCQVNLAKAVPAGFLENETEILLLKARFVFWANEVIYEESRTGKEVPA